MWSVVAPLIDYLLLSLLSIRKHDLFCESAGVPLESFEERLERWRSAECDIEPVEQKGARTRYRAIVRAFGKQFETAFFHDRVVDNGRLVVFHHGLAERPPGGSYRFLLADRPDVVAADRVCLVALGHVKGQRDLRERGRSIEGFGDILACSVAVARAVAERLPGYTRRALCGVSLGGIVTLLESLHEPRYDAHVSIVATPFLAEQALHSSFRRFVDVRFRNRVSVAGLRVKTDFDDRLARDGRRVVMLNGLHDTMVNLDRLRAFWATRPAIEPHELACSHLSMVVRPRQIAVRLAAVLQRELGL